MGTQPDPAEAATVAARLQDRVEIIDAVYRFAVGQDFHRKEYFESAFTEDGVLDFVQPGERFGATVELMVGRSMIVERGFPVEQTLVITHSITNERVTIDGDEARLFALVEAQHVVPDDPERHFLLKNLYDVALRREAPGWRMTHLRIENLWADGDPSVLFKDLAR